MMCLEKWLKDNCYMGDFDDTKEELRDYTHTSNVIEYMQKYAEYYFIERTRIK